MAQILKTQRTKYLCISRMLLNGYSPNALSRRYKLNSEMIVKVLAMTLREAKVAVGKSSHEFRDDSRLVELRRTPMEHLNDIDKLEHFWSRS